MARKPGMDTAKPPDSPEVKAETQENDDNELPSTWEPCMHRTVRGTAVHKSDWRPDVQHPFNKVLLGVAAPTRLDLRQMKLLLRYFMPA